MLPPGADLLWFDFSLLVEVAERRGQIQLLDPGGHGGHVGGCVGSDLTVTAPQALLASLETSTTTSKNG